MLQSLTHIRSILNALGQKYDQYLDFAQQDAHEFLRILLDAMRMEEQDVRKFIVRSSFYSLSFQIIKKRQPPPPHQKKRRRTTITSADSSFKTADKREEPGLLSFADMIFGGQLTSILVCQKCKHVSQTYEDFNDISLSIKPEDYYTHKKRDRFKKMVGRLTAFPGSSSNKHHAPVHIPANQVLEMHRSSSVPPSPRTERDVELPIVDGPRRRSLDVETKEAESESAPDSPELPSQQSAKEGENESSNILVSVTAPEEKHIEFVDQKDQKDRQENAQSALESGSEKEGSKDSWAKIGRRISLSVGLGRSRGHEKEKEKEKKEKEKDRKSRSMDRGGLGGFIKEVVAEVDMGIQKSLSANSAMSSSHSDLHKREKNRISSDANLRAPSPGPTDPAQVSSSPSSSSTHKLSKPLPPPPQPASTSTSTSPKHPSSSPSFLNTANATSSIFPVQRSKSPKPPKPSHAETEYLRRILADVATAPPSNNPFAIFKPPLLHTHSSHHGSRLAFTSYNYTTTSGASVTAGEKPTWMSIGMRNLSGIEECLRMFTAVEVLDGENMVGCRRCWKIQNGQLPTSKDSDQEEEEEEANPPKDQPEATYSLEASIKGVDTIIRPPLQVIPPSLSSGTAVHIPTSISTPTVSFYSHEDDASDTRSVSSLPEPTSPSLTSFESAEGSSTADSSFSMLEVTSDTSTSDAAGPGGLPIPVISTTAPESPPSSSLEFSSTLPSTAAEIDSNHETAYSRLTDSQNSAPPSVSSPGPSPHPRLTQALYGYSSSSKSKESLVIPKIGRNGLRRRSYADTHTDYESSDDDSDTSVGTSISGDSAFSSQQTLPPSKSQPQINGTKSTANSVALSSKVQQVSASTPAPQKKIPKPPKPTIMRPAYKRYLIAVPPPVLVIHLKRFQQTSKTPLMSFSHGFKKLDDYVSFPEYLDLMPFLAPRKEDYGLGKNGKDKEKKHNTKEDRCMYRLYAVVVHIGNMVTDLVNFVFKKSLILFCYSLAVITLPIPLFHLKLPIRLLLPAVIILVPAFLLLPLHSPR